MACVVGTRPSGWPPPALVAVVASSLVAGGARSASPSSGQVAFTRSPGKNSGVYVMREDGSGSGDARTESTPAIMESDN